MTSSRNISIAAHIIPETESCVQAPGWRKALADGFTDVPSLLEYLQIEPSAVSDHIRASRQFSLRVPKVFATLMRKGYPDDPLLLQVLPSASEMDLADGFSTDPVGDHMAGQSPGLLQKYHGRILIITTGACAVHCRYCFRRHYPYTGATATNSQWRHIIDYLETNPAVEEVILSGGDPLMISDDKLERWLAQLEALPQIKRLRIHTRLPVVLPQRITAELLSVLKRCPINKVMVIHANHPNELSPAVAEGMKRVAASDVTLLNQSVLLKGVNDHCDTLVRLSNRLFEIGVLPYYLHLLDRVEGAAHFELEKTAILRLQQQLMTELPGYLMPRMVREIAGVLYKTPIQICPL
ncbi:MAG: EF-P beta-lysylation protein EpmB [Candidatus Thiodiazotropha taylori]|nr:EF-P beta-lysylation protein EpmB [Candidatus Thiodiazotropha taylori]MCG8075802.1 EF-P beta-lysylation protein EpmB [Candidatus Thiodiazotropha taylori]MCW4307786.1 EF-P beta-lysylation protein EpmB [Candidatus Thiodiazotropha endolucinida]